MMNNLSVKGDVAQLARALDWQFSKWINSNRINSFFILIFKTYNMKDHIWILYLILYRLNIV